MTAAPHRTGTTRSGDVDLFYRLFGAGTGTPVVIAHGANYYDSYDWIDVAAKLARNRAVVAYDGRGYGLSSWSAAKDYTTEANTCDVKAVADEFDWRRVIVLGHSRGGAFATQFAAHFPDRVAGLVLIDALPEAAEIPPAPIRAIGKTAEIYPTMDAALAATSRDPAVAPGSPAAERLAMFLRPVEGGYVLAQRDPDFRNQMPLVPAYWPIRIPPQLDMRRAMKRVEAPILIVRALHSHHDHSPAVIAGLHAEFPTMEMVTVDSGHDVATGAPDALVDAVERFAARLAG